MEGAAEEREPVEEYSVDMGLLWFFIWRTEEVVTMFVLGFFEGGGRKEEEKGGGGERTGEGRAEKSGWGGRKLRLERRKGRGKKENEGEKKTMGGECVE